DRVPVLHHDVAGDFGGVLVGQALVIDRTAGVFRVDLHADVPVVPDVGAEHQAGAGFQELHVRSRQRLGGDGGLVTELAADLPLAPLLVEDENLRVGEH